MRKLARANISPLPLWERARVRARARMMTQISRARELRKQSTDAERLLWSGLRGRRLVGLRFRHQSPIEKYIVDFVCYEHNLIVEIDGGHHQEQRASDLCRTEWLNSRGFSVIRYWNNQVLEDMDSVLESIRMTLEVGPSPQPSPQLRAGQASHVRSWSIHYQPLPDPAAEEPRGRVP